ncbi:MAG: sigma-70 family RNA polymerase sigma factor [Kofleriaceae bacterium]|nr:sigma-70 family RNA polymerase sigma factor [Kofleriaceae bacterium]
MGEPSTCCCGDWIAGLARTHAGRLAAIARREGASAADALDVVQDAFHTLLARPDIDALRDQPEHAARLLATITRNAARNLRRRHHLARPHVDVDATELTASTPTPPEALDHALARAQLVGCVAKLGDVHRHVITLRVLEELSGDEAAATLGVTPGHVAVLLHRARKQLEQCMLAS